MRYSRCCQCVDPLSEMAAQPEFGNPDMARDASVLLSVCGPEAIAAAAATVAAKGNTDVPQTHRILKLERQLKETESALCYAKEAYQLASARADAVTEELGLWRGVRKAGEERGPN